ncbi:bifunctional isocitrate dehydrogenase kinase/phosphatase, partial [Longibacter sp.]|uniref:bifunctional isocitrate dehydrogenase kinase/phosphatase n=1 Tax=Longibacter sp. TaxID=2045415 RepID=UPI003EBAFA8B
MSAPPRASSGPPFVEPPARRHARLICDAFDAYQARFRVITRRAQRRFEHRNWNALRSDATERLTLYRQVVDHIESDTRHHLRDRLHSKDLWRQIRSAYSKLTRDKRDAELAETFYNSLTRRIFNTVGVDPHIEFVTTDITGPHEPPEEPVAVTFSDRPSTDAYLDAILEAYAFDAPYARRTDDIRRAARFIDRRLDRRGLDGPIRQISLARPVFYRGIGAYLVGSLTVGDVDVPFTLSFHHDDDGIVIDAVLLREDDVSILFSFARSYFLVDTQHPHSLVHFLKDILPRKRIAELYIAIGYNKHGKTELYRDLLHHFQHTDDQFERAAGQRGMVMTVFTMPSYDMVFKLIKDEFDYPKSTTRAAVKDRYHLVFKHDRAGRLVDAQEFEHLRLNERLFRNELENELLDIASDTVHHDGDRVTIDHCYVERRVTPLDLYIRENDYEASRAALADYGNAIKDLARTNIFPGDLLLKNFGVTRHGRVVFYDYDELGFVTDYNFRSKPQAQNYMDELSADAWFYVGPDDVFPEEFRVTMGVSDELMAAFESLHGDLFTASFWNDV